MPDRYDIERDRERMRDREQYREPYGGRADWDRNRVWGRDYEQEGFNQGRRDWERRRLAPEGRYEDPDRERTADFGDRGDWGNAGRWSTFGNRPDYNRDYNNQGSYFGGIGSFGGGLGAYNERGLFRGRGPKNWQRSDERIREDLNERLTDNAYLDAQEIEVQVKTGEVTLTGSVDDRNAKRLAEDIAVNILGVRDVHNQLRIQQTAEQGAQRSSAASKR